MNTLKIVFIAVVTTLLFGCHGETIYQLDESTLVSQRQISLLEKQLDDYDVRVINDGDSLVLILPNKTFFNPNSANFSKKAYKALDLIADLMGYYEKSVISVVGFAEASFVDAIGKAIVAERAHKIGSYLWNLGIDARFIYAKEKIADVIEKNSSPLTDCVVINFRKLNE